MEYKIWSVQSAPGEDAAADALKMILVSDTNDGWRLHTILDRTAFVTDKADDGRTPSAFLMVYERETPPARSGQVWTG